MRASSSWFLFLPALVSLGFVACSDNGNPAVDDSGVISKDGSVAVDGTTPPTDGGTTSDVFYNPDARPTDPCTPGAGPIRVRLLAGNITSGNKQSYEEGSGIRIFQALIPDVVMIQEFNYKNNSAGELREFVDVAFGKQFSFSRGGGQIPNGIVTRFPIISSGEWIDPRVTNRSFAWAQIDVPGKKDLWAVSVHLLTSSSTERKLEGDALTAFIQTNVPAGAYVVIGGDFNTDMRSEELLPALAPVVTIPATFPDDGAGNGNTSTNRSKPYDWVLVDGALNTKEVPLVIKSKSFPTGLVFDTSVYTPLSDLMPPLLGGESKATNMQHMAVARDFELVCGQ